MAVRIEKGGWFLIFLIGLALVGYSLNRYGMLDSLKNRGRSASAPAATARSDQGGGAVDTSKPLALPAAGSTTRDPQVRIRVNIWVGCAGGLVANGGLDTQPGSIFAQQGARRLVQDHRRLDRRRGRARHRQRGRDADHRSMSGPRTTRSSRTRASASHAFLMVDWSRGADGVIGKQGINSIEDLAGKTVAFAPYTPSHFLLWNGLKNSGLDTAQRNEIFSQGRAHQGRHRAGDPLRPKQGGRRGGLGPGHERRRGQAAGCQEDLRHPGRQPADRRHPGGQRQLRGQVPADRRQAHAKAGSRAWSSSRRIPSAPTRSSAPSRTSTFPSRPRQDDARRRAPVRLRRQPGLLRQPGRGERLRQRLPTWRRRCTASCG